VEKDSFLTKKEVMEYLRISQGTLYKLMKRRAFPYIKLERKVLFKKADIDRFLESKIVK
jgi:excisionase family DNA binding protein